MSVDADLATLRGTIGMWRYKREGDWDARVDAGHDALSRVEAELSRLREELDAWKMYDRQGLIRRAESAEARITELLQQDSYMERRLAAQREDIERLATRVETAEAEAERLRSDKDERDWRTLEIVTAQAQAAEAECAELAADLENEAVAYERVQERCARLQQALAFYADPSTYEESAEPDPGRFATGIIPIRDDEGGRAREALAGPGGRDAV